MNGTVQPRVHEATTAYVAARHPKMPKTALQAIEAALVLLELEETEDLLQPDALPVRLRAEK